MYRLFRQSKHLSTSLISIPALSIPQPNTSFFTPKISYTKKNAVNTQKPVRKIILLRTGCIFGQFCKLKFSQFFISVFFLFQLINRPIVEITKINADVREKIPSVTTNMINVANGI